VLTALSAPTGSPDGTKRSGVWLAGAAAALRELAAAFGRHPFSPTSQSSSANLLLRPISPDHLLYLVFWLEFF